MVQASSLIADTVLMTYHNYRGLIYRFMRNATSDVIITITIDVVLIPLIGTVNNNSNINNNNLSIYIMLIYN